jgi:hypothetical protein
LNDSRNNSILLKTFQRKTEDLQVENDELKQEILKLRTVNQDLLEECSKLSDLNIQLNSQRNLLEIELERLTQVVYCKDDQIHDLIDRNEYIQSLSSRNSPKVFNRSGPSPCWVFRDDHQRAQVFEGQKQKMKSLASQSVSSLHHQRQSPKFPEHKNLSEIRALIRQAQESQKARKRSKVSNFQ